MSETKNLKLKKHDNVETNTNTFDIENYLNKNWDKIDEKDGKMNKTIQAFQIENQQLKEDLKGLPNATVKGENIDLNDSAEMRVLGFGVGGNSRQEGEPTPETPVEVESCGGNINLFDKNNVTILDAIINSTSKVISSFFGCKTFYIPCQKNKQITISRKEGTRFIVGTTTSIPSLNAVCNQIKINNTGTSITLVTGDNDNYLVVFYYNSGSDILTEQEILDSIKVEQNSKATPYSKYGQGNINIEICNKNKFNKDNIQIGKAWNLSNNTSRSIFVCKVKPNTKYTITFENIDNFEGLHLFEKTNYDDTVLSRNILQITKSTKITTNSETNYIGIQFNKSNVSLSDFTNLKLQIEENDTETQIIEHQSQTYTIPTQQPMLEDDKFDWENKEEVHIWGKYNFTGNEYFSVIAPGIYRYNAKANNLGIKPVNNGVVAKAICNRLKVETATHVSSGSDYNNHFGISTTGTIDINMQDYETVEKFKVKLKELYNEGAPLYIWYELEEEKRLPFTEEQKTVAKQIENAKTYKGVTHIYSTDKVSPNMEVTYLKDIEMMIQGG